MQKFDTKERFIKRTEARELFMKLLFQMQIQNEYGLEIKEKFIQEYIKEEEPLKYFNRLYHAAVDHLTEIDKRLEECSENWKLNRMSKVDLAVLRLSCAELLYIEDVPDSASINEAVELAKKYSNEDSGKFVNGILGKVARSKHEQ